MKDNSSLALSAGANLAILHNVYAHINSLRLVAGHQVGQQYRDRFMRLLNEHLLVTYVTEDVIHYFNCKGYVTSDEYMVFSELTNAATDWIVDQFKKDSNGYISISLLGYTISRKIIYSDLHDRWHCPRGQVEDRDGMSQAIYEKIGLVCPPLDYDGNRHTNHLKTLLVRYANENGMGMSDLVNIEIGMSRETITTQRDGVTILYTDHGLDLGDDQATRKEQRLSFDRRYPFSAIPCKTKALLISKWLVGDLENVMSVTFDIYVNGKLIIHQYVQRVGSPVEYTWLTRSALAAR